MILLDRVSKTYTKSGHPSLDRISLHVEPNEFVIVVGASGAGKTTLMRLLTREERQTSGKIIIGGIDFDKLKDKEIPQLRRKIGVVFQDFKLLPNKTIFENVAFALEMVGMGNHEIRNTVPKVLEIVNLSGKENSMPVELSGGERQRVAIARAIVRQPKILIADEPTGNLDPKHAWDVIKILEKVNRFGTTVLLTTHNQEIVNRLKRRVVTIKDGKIVSDRANSGYKSWFHSGGQTKALRIKRRLMTLWRIINSGLVNFIRNLSLAVAAMAIMVVTLTIVLFSLVINDTFSHTINQITSKIDISVYLNDNVSTSQSTQLLSQLRHLPDVASVTYESKDQVLKAYLQQNASNQQLVQAVSETSNPLPATIIIKPVDLNHLGQIKAFLSKPQVSALQSDPPSYSGQEKEAIDRITHATNVLQRIGVFAVIIFTVVSVLIIFNTIQMAIFNRRDEIHIMRLLGASTGYIRGPFIVESITYGILAAIISIIIINAAFQASSSTLQASSLGLLDIGYANRFFDNHFIVLLLIQLGLGIVIGAVSSLIATRRYLKFKIR